MKPAKLSFIFLTCLVLFFLFMPAAQAYNQLVDANGHVLHWLDADIPPIYYLNNTGTYHTDTELNALRAGFTTWGAVSTATIYFTDGGVSSNINYGTRDSVNLLGWPAAWSDDPNIIALCTFWYQNTDGRIIESDIAFNATDYSWNTTGALADMDIQNIATHEIGHFLGLGDLYGTGDVDKTMYGYSSAGEVIKRTLAQDDIDGVSATYPGSSGLTISSFYVADQTTASQDVTDSQTVDYAITVSGTATQIIMSENSDFSGASWQSYAESGTFTLSAAYGLKTVYVKVKNTTEESSPASASISYSNVAAPTISSFSVRDAVSGSTSYTNNQSVSVAVTAFNATFMKISEDPSFFGIDWEDFDDAFSFLLSSGAGTKTVYYKVENGFATESSVSTASIVFDATPPIIQIKSDGNLLLNNDRIKNIFTLTGVITDIAPINASTLKIYIDSQLVTDGTDASGHYDTYDQTTKILSYHLKSGLAPGTHQIKIEAADLAGNAGLKEATGLKYESGLNLSEVVNFPNPFSDTTKFSYQLTQPADITIKIYSIRGRLVKTLTASGGSSGGQTGFNTISWNGNNESGARLPNDAYIYIISANSGGSRIIQRGRLAILK